MKKTLLIFFSIFFLQYVWTKDKTSQEDSAQLENNEKVEKGCELIEEYIPIEKDNIQNIAGTDREIGGVKLRPQGCAWNPEKGWHRP
tara:strand:- start:111 stop:371 length:261 start_codon:yes stop_codon:yes gene_type:complete